MASDSELHGGSYGWPFILVICHLYFIYFDHSESQMTESDFVARVVFVRRTDLQSLLARYLRKKHVRLHPISSCFSSSVSCRFRAVLGPRAHVADDAGDAGHAGDAAAYAGAACSR